MSLWTCSVVQQPASRTSARIANVALLPTPRAADTYVLAQIDPRTAAEWKAWLDAEEEYLDHINAYFFTKYRHSKSKASP